MMNPRTAVRSLALLRPRPARWAPAAPSLPQMARTHASHQSQPKDSATAPTDPKYEGKDLSNPILEEYLEKKEREERLEETSQSKAAGPPAPRYGTLSKHPSNIFTSEAEIEGWHDSLEDNEKAALKARAEARKKATDIANELKLSEMTLDPDQKARRRLERRLVIGGVKRRGRSTKAQTLARTERQSLYRSQDLPASVKKLQKLMNQIAGKTVSEALVQLRFSKKKVARDVAKGLEIAQNEAIVGRGMGLGGGATAKKRWELQRNNIDTGKVRDIALPNINHGAAQREVEQRSKVTQIELKDGSKKMVRDPTEIYIDQAWVGKGDTGKSLEYRARGQINVLRHRTTSFSVLLKEEKTRMRISEEIKKKRDNRKLWTALPDRPVTAQRQYCLW